MTTGIRVDLELQDGSFTSRMIHAGETVQRFERNVGQSVVAIKAHTEATGSFLGTLRDLTIVAGAASMAIGKIREISSGLMADIVKVNAEMERMTVLMRSMSTAADPMKDAVEQVRALRNIVREVPFSLQTMTDVMVKMKATGLDPMKGGLKALADGVAGAGGTEEGLKRAALAISQMAGKGVIQMEELRQQLGETMPRAVELMARSMGVSMQTLIKEISTGTVQAKPALQMFLDEVKRTYGGAAKEQMQTFTGMKNLMMTNLQEVALQIGNAGFFDAVKTQLGDLNRLLSSDIAKSLGTSLGQTLTNIVNSVRSALNWVIEFRGAIYDLGVVMATVFGSRLILSGLFAMANSIKTTAAEVAALRVQYAALTQQMNANSMANAIYTITNGANGISTTALAMRNLAGAMGLVGATLSVVAPWLPLLGLAVWGVAEYFGLFANKARDAWQELERFGAQSRKQAEEGSKFIAQREEELKKLELKRDLAARRKGGRTGEADSLSREIEVRQADLERMREASQRYLVQGIEADAKREAEVRMGAFEIELRAEAGKYDRRRVLQNQAYDEEVKTLVAQGRSIIIAEEKNQTLARNEAVSYYDRRLELLQNYWKSAEILEQTGTDTQKRAAAMLFAQIGKMIDEAKSERDRALNQAMGVPVLPKSINDAKLYKKGEQDLLNLQSKIEGLRATLKGANGDVAELQELLANMKVGDPGIPKVQELIDKLLEAKRVQTELQELQDSQTKFRSAIDRATEREKEKIIELNSEGLSEAQKIMMRAQAGLYGKGLFNPTDTQRDMRVVQDQLYRTEQASKRLGESFKETFGNSMMGLLGNFTSALERIGSLFLGMSNNVGNMNANGAAMGSPDGRRVNMGDGSARDLLIRTVYGEAGGEIEQGIVGVIQVIKNRLLNGKWGDTLESVILSPKQFSVWNPGDAAGRKANMLSTEDAAYKRIAALVDAAFRGELADPTGGATHYLNKRTADAVNTGPSGWGSTMTNQRQIGNHTFGNSGTVPQTNSRNIPFDTGAESNVREEDEARLKRLDQLQKEREYKEASKKLSDDEKRILEEVNDKTEQIVGTNKRVEEIKRKIRKGEYDDKDRDPESERYKSILAAAAAYDRADEDYSKRRAARRKSERARDALDRARLDNDERGEAARDALNDPNNLRYSSSYLALQRRLRRESDNIRADYGEDSPEYKRALEDQQTELRRFRNTEIMEHAGKLARENQETRASLMDERQMRSEQLRIEIERLQEELRVFTGTAEERAQVEAALQQRIALLRQKTAQESPMGKMFKEWRDASGAFERQFSSMMESSVDALAGFVATGKLDFRSLIQSWAKDILKISIKSLFTKMGGDKLLSGLFSKGGGAAKGGGKGGGLAKIGGLFGVAHTGAIVGEGFSSHRIASPALFMNAPRFHGGGIIGSDEVPIIAKKKEGVFTPEQMAQLQVGGNNAMAFTINSPITVNGSAGTPQQNADLAKQMSRQMEQTMRNVVVDEMRRQMKPGNMLNRR